MEDNKKCTTIWLRPSVIRRMDAWMEEANCRSRSELIEKAVRFYMGYLGTEDTSEYLSDALVATLRGIIADSANRTNGILFKCAVEQGIMAHTIAAKGCFVAPKNVELLREETLKNIENHIDQIVRLSQSVGLSEQEVLDMVRFAMED